MGLSNKAKLIIGGIITTSIINMPIATPKCTVDCSNIELNTVDKLIKGTNDKIEENKQCENNNMLNEIGREYIKLQEENKIKKELESHRRRVLFTVTYYTNSYSEGGHRDKKGKYLVNHNMPVVALPKNISYGCRVEFDNEVLGNTEYINVDSGNAIQWINDNECVVDVFVPYASQSYLNKLGKHKVWGYIYDLGY